MPNREPVLSQVQLNLSSSLPEAALAQLTRDLKTALLREGFMEPDEPKSLAVGERGDPVTIGAIVLAAFGSGGAAGALIKCVQTILARDHTLRITLKPAKGTEIVIDAKNIASADLRAAIEAAAAAAKT